MVQLNQLSSLRIFWFHCRTPTLYQQSHKSEEHTRATKVRNVTFTQIVQPCDAGLVLEIFCPFLWKILTTDLLSGTLVLRTDVIEIARSEVA